MGSVSKSCSCGQNWALFVVGGGAGGGAVVALSMLVGVCIVDSLIDNVAWNLGFGVVHTVALKTYTGWASSGYVSFVKQ